MKIAVTPDLYEQLVDRLRDRTAVAVGLPAASVSLVSLKDSSGSNGSYGSNGSNGLSVFSILATLNITTPLPSSTSSALLTAKKLYAAFLSNYGTAFEARFLAASFNVTGLSTALFLGEAPTLFKPPPGSPKPSSPPPPSGSLLQRPPPSPKPSPPKQGTQAR